MKKSIVTIMSLLVLVLSACGGSQSVAVTEQAAEVTEAAEVGVTEVAAAEAYPASTEAAEEVATTGVLNADYDNAVSVEMQLVLGTLKLDGTAQAITAEQANTLLALWMTYQTVLQSAMPNQGQPGQGMPAQGQAASGTPAADMGASQAMPTVDPAVQTQLDDLMKQIQAAMTAEQITAIADMKITTETAMTIMQEQMAAMGVPQQGDGSGAGGGQQPPLGGQSMPQGTPGADKGQMGGAQGGPQGSGQGAGGMMDSGMVQPQLVQAVISALQKIAGVESSSS
jgi:hypothetical protein